MKADLLLPIFGPTLLVVLSSPFFTAGSGKLPMPYALIIGCSIVLFASLVLYIVSVLPAWYLIIRVEVTILAAFKAVAVSTSIGFVVGLPFALHLQAALLAALQATLKLIGSAILRTQSR